MNSSTTKQLIADYLKEKTEFYGIDHLQYFTTNRISYQLNISRSLASQYLNELCKEQTLVKVSSRPVYYFYRKGLEKKYEVHLSEIEYYNMNDLMNAISKKEQMQDEFCDVIGYDGSLHACISQMKSAMMYPPDGLPIVIEGEKHLETEMLVKKLFAFCKNAQILSSQAKLKRLEILSDNQVEMEEILFPKEGGSLLDKVNGGIVYIVHAHALHKEVQRKLADYLLHHSQHKKKARVILKIDEDAYGNLEEHLQISVPLVCTIPAWRNRNRYEREEFIIQSFKKEEERLRKPIRITKNLFQTLSEQAFLGNLDEVKNTIRGICVNAWLYQKEEDLLDVKFSDLPSSITMKRQAERSFPLSSEETFLIDEQQHIDANERMLKFFDQLLDAHISYQENHAPFTAFCTKGFELLREYYDYIVFDERFDGEAIKKMEGFMNQILKSIEVQHQITLPLNCSFVLARIACKFSNKFHVISQWENQRRHDISACLKSLMEYLPAETMMAMEMSRSLSKEMDIKLSDGNLIFLILNIHFYNAKIQQQEICALIISHGYSTASSIGDACNQLLQTHIFKAIDMPLDTSIDQIIEQIKDFIKLYPYYQSMILMVDMGSLVEIGRLLKVDKAIGIINNISTGLALEVGNAILQHQDLEPLLKDACEHAQCQYQIISRKEKEKAIVFTNDAGIEVSKRMAALFQDSLMKPIKLKFMEYDYPSLVLHQEKDPLFEKYDVALIVKPYTLELENIPSLSLEDIVGFRDVERLHQVLRAYLTQEEIEIFDQHLLKNFSLQSVMEHLTILNPTHLMDYISDAIGQLQRLMHQKFHSKTIAGIYIHISFLMERLVTKNAIETHEDLSLFERKQQQFIEDVNTSFDAMLKHYNVVLPISEIAYLYDYILHDEKLHQ